MRESIGTRTLGLTPGGAGFQREVTMKFRFVCMFREDPRRGLGEESGREVGTCDRQTFGALKLSFLKVKGAIPGGKATSQLSD